MTVFIGGAWPYANGSLHLGHIAALLPGDILARFYRQKGEKVLYVSGSDCNGTPISIRANQENTTIEALANRYHEEFVACFEKLGFSYDLYTRTDAEHHHKSVQAIFLKLLDNGYLYKKTSEQAFCETDHQFLPDRFVEGTCPNCGEKARGDQCDHCSAILDPLDLIDKRCKICGNEPTIKETEHFYFSFSQFQSKLESWVIRAEKENRWRKNAISLTTRYLNEGVPDRAVTRDLPNGVDVPLAGFEGKKIYVWIEAVAGYLTASKEWANQNNENLEDWWNGDTISYYVHGKDNIPFHTIVWPSILMGIGNSTLPTRIISNEYLTLENRKLSTSQNWAVWAPYMLERYDADSIRYFLTINAPENRDTNFSWREFVYSHNSELLGAYGNFVNRTLKFIQKSYDGKTPSGKINIELQGRVNRLYNKAALLITDGQFKKTIENIFDFVRFANKYFDEQKPWIQINEERSLCDDTMANCIYIISNLAQLLHPFLPFSSKKVKEMLGLNEFTWKEIDISSISLKNIQPLFNRIDVKNIQEEIHRLNERI
ncbi:methionine--tRNA ligase [Fictibacillus phosphorivorans]|uniref:Methionine--tRNA ligase n=1 Tax=Fictibacillus phosphorivorans TaxID=1221500 RepID=A0A160IMT9_9BACL|nr:methionine--tRNA ligase [Fictibacillus phosphorivorans]ANC77504.1 methionine--tRNA ligase [Fictibacillus phosphorivorans]